MPGDFACFAINMSATNGNLGLKKVGQTVSPVLSRWVQRQSECLL